MEVIDRGFSCTIIKLYKKLLDNNKVYNNNSTAAILNRNIRATLTMRTISEMER